MSPEIKELLLKIEEKLGWGNSASWQNRDFENLNERILAETGVSLSASTLRRIWGKVEYNHMPSMTTLDTLAKFAGFVTWRDFQKSTSSGHKNKTEETVPQQQSGRYGATLMWIAGAVVVISLLSLFVTRNKVQPTNKENYSFSSELLTRDIPNSVIFKYDASATPSDSVFIQQSWDERTKSPVDKNRHTFTSVYYEPGFYQAKLIIDGAIVKEHPLLIPSNGWLGMIDNKPVPVYLPSNEFFHQDKLQVRLADIINKNISMQPRPPVVKYFNVGNFDPVPISDFAFKTIVRNEYNEGAAACQISYIFLITDGAPIAIPLSAKGCVSEIFVRGVDTMIGGKNEDLSGFGVDFEDWVEVGCKSANGKIRYLINDNEVYSIPLPRHRVSIVGLGYIFVGTGAVKGIVMEGSGKRVFEAF